MNEAQYRAPVTDAERRNALASWPSLTAEQFDAAVLPAGMERLAMVTWTIKQPTPYHEFTHELWVRDESDARRQIASAFLMPGTSPDAIKILKVIGI